MEKLELIYPLAKIFITQKFGDNGIPYYKSIGMLGHNGIDYAAKDGTKVYATHEGICNLQIDSNGGNGVVIISEKHYDYNGKSMRFKSIYWHLKENNQCVEQGQKVKAGDLIGYADNTGLSTGSHLHFALKPVYEGETKEQTYNFEQKNGYFGAINPQPYFNGTYITEKYLFTKLLKKGMWNSDVVELQEVLKKLGFYNGIIDGGFGKMTFEAVKKYQKLKGLVVDGIVGKNTNVKLNE